MNKAQNLYINTQVNTAQPGELTLMLYNGCLKFMKQALEGLNKKDYEAKNINLKKAQDIINELIITLDMKYEISNQLFALYNFIRDRLFYANIELDIASLQMCIDFIRELRDTWSEALKVVKSNNKVSI
ncbi:flagellar export chaperone FliS [Paenibacillus sp. V4I3]|uniref:flagellar export chaperone FliS n=1 Tax=Paenibacillus sp. V4I3 TaxID=3042305 RepID=UPI0027D883ED|nr:flagellar export chaperone FliS [Paenibacillus sp. V4I3]